MREADGCFWRLMLQEKAGENEGIGSVWAEAKRGVRDFLDGNWATDVGHRRPLVASTVESSFFFFQNRAFHQIS